MICTLVESQNVPVLDATYISGKVKYFTVEDGQIIGDGMDYWNKIISESQFIAYGERHNSKSTSLLFEALLPMVARANYNNFIIEVGPHSAKKLEKLSKTPSETEANMRKFLMKYGSLEYEFEPIPFFSGKEDAKFLQKAAEAHMNIVGIDQEFIYAVSFLLDDIMGPLVSHPKYDDILKLQEQAKSKIKYWLVKEETSEEDISAFKEILKEDVVNTFFTEASKLSIKSKAIINDLLISWDIYIRWREDSHVDRISYMRNNFKKHYSVQLKEADEPKFILKFGNLHTSKSFTNGAYDLGHLVTELAKENNTKATIINSWTRYYKTDKGITDYFEKYNRYYNRYRVFMSFADKNKWAIIDLESIREDIKQGKVLLPVNGDYHKLKYLIDSYDYQLILPLDSERTLNISN